MLQEGTLAPDFSLASDGERDIRLSDYRGKKVVLYFYPKDDTPGCTTEACNFRDNVTSHVKFKLKVGLPFALLSDPDHRVAEMYGAWGEKKMFGRTYMGIIRSTYVIDEEGMITKVFPKVRTKVHSQEVLEVLKGSVVT